MTTPKSPQVFISFRGKDLRNIFIPGLVAEMEARNINVFIDNHEILGRPLDVLFDRIEESRVAVALFSPLYTDSDFCLRELAKMKERMDQNKLVVIPIFYMLEPNTVKYQQGTFGDNFRIQLKSVDENTKAKWTDALKNIPRLKGLVYQNGSLDEFKLKIVDKVARVLQNLPPSTVSPNHPLQESCVITEKEHEISWGIEQRLTQLEEKLHFVEETTRIVGVVGIPGIGKSTVASKLYQKFKSRFCCHAFVPNVNQLSKECGLDYLSTELVQGLLNANNINIDINDSRNHLLKHKVFVVVDNVSSKEQITALLGTHDWIKQGSKLVIVTTDKSIIQDGVVHDIYEVPRLCDKDGLEYFTQYALDDQEKKKHPKLLKLSQEFVHYTKGNPLALNVLGDSLRGKDEAYWIEKLEAVSQRPNKILHNVWKGSYDGLSQQQKDTLLDIACCFKSLDQNYVASVLECYEPDSSDGKSEITELINKSLISISGSQVEMHDTLYMLSRELGYRATAPDGIGRRRLWQHQTIIDIMNNAKLGASCVRSISLDLSDVKKERSFHSQAFVPMKNLRHLKIYSSHCPHDCDHDNKLIFPDGLKLPLHEVRCLHWLRFPLKELPTDFSAENLVDLKLPYSEIERVWEGEKDTSKLKWIDLNHSCKLSTLCGLAEARNLQELNLDGCTSLEILPHDMENMKSLLILNLRGCTRLKSLPEIKLSSLKSLILSGCSKYKIFHVISDKLETLYLDGTAIKELPLDIQILQNLVLLSMSGCKKLKKLPESLGELKALQELRLSGCSKLKEFPQGGENMKALGILLMDETDMEETPRIFSVQRLCLRGNDKIIRLPNNISQFYQLKCLDVKNCKNLTHLPEVPPSLQCLDASGCKSLKTVAKPLTRSMPTEQQVHSSFIFMDCSALEQAAKEEITSYATEKLHMLPSAHKRCIKGLVPEIFFSTCFPGCDIPSWFCHQAIGSVIDFKLPPHWKAMRPSGIALSVVFSFQDCQDESNSLFVKFTCQSEFGEGFETDITWKIGGWTKNENIGSEHVFMAYTSCSHITEFLQDKQPRECAATEVSLEFIGTTSVPNQRANFKVLKNGFRFVFDPNENSQEAKVGALLLKP